MDAEAPKGFPAGLTRKGAPMSKVHPRNFDCPQTGERCTNGGCTPPLRCIETERARIALSSAAATAPERRQREAVTRVVSKFLRKKENSN